MWLIFGAISAVETCSWIRFSFNFICSDFGAIFVTCTWIQLDFVWLVFGAFSAVETCSWIRFSFNYIWSDFGANFVTCMWIQFDFMWLVFGAISAVETCSWIQLGSFLFHLAFRWDFGGNFAIVKWPWIQKNLDFRNRTLALRYEWINSKVW